MQSDSRHTGSLIGGEVSPASCALLLAPPLTFEEFKTDVAAASHPDARAARGDYAFGIAQRFDGDVEAAWKGAGEHVATLCRHLIAEARAAAVPAHAIFERACAADFAKVTAAGARVVLLIGHWRSAGVKSGDLRSGFEQRLRHEIAEPADPLARALRRHVEHYPFLDPAALRPSELADCLSRFISTEALAIDAELRDELDHRFADVLVPGEVLELRDGYHKPAALAELIAPTWTGVFDLGICHSLRLAVTLKQKRDNRHIVTNERAKEPDRCLREMRETLVRLAARPASYLETRARVFREYSQMLREL